MTTESDYEVTGLPLNSSRFNNVVVDFSRYLGETLTQDELDN